MLFKLPDPLPGHWTDMAVHRKAGVTRELGMSAHRLGKARTAGWGQPGLMNECTEEEERESWQGE